MKPKTHPRDAKRRSIGKAKKKDKPAEGLKKQMSIHQTLPSSGMAQKSRIKRRAKKRPNSVKQAEEGVKAAQDVFARFLAKVDPESVKK